MSTKRILEDSHLQIKAVPNSSGTDSLLGKSAENQRLFSAYSEKSTLQDVSSPRQSLHLCSEDSLNKNPKPLLNLVFESTQVDMVIDGSLGKTLKCPYIKIIH